MWCSLHVRHWWSCWCRLEVPFPQIQGIRVNKGITQHTALQNMLACGMHVYDRSPALEPTWHWGKGLELGAVAILRSSFQILRLDFHSKDKLVSSYCRYTCCCLLRNMYSYMAICHLVTAPIKCSRSFNKMSGCCLSIKMLSYQYEDSHYKDKMVSWPSYICNGNPCSWKDSLDIETTPWFSALVQNFTLLSRISMA